MTPYQIKSEGVFEDFFQHKHLFGFSIYAKDEDNKKVIGKMNDVKEGKINGEFVGLKSKMYSIKNKY